jgi:hypothetical protein
LSIYSFHNYSFFSDATTIVTAVAVSSLSGTDHVITVVNNGNGSFSSQLSLSQEGAYLLYVKLNGHNVRDSPFTVTVVAPPAPPAPAPAPSPSTPTNQVSRTPTIHKASAELVKPRICRGCNQAITKDFMSLSDWTYHIECFVCCNCRQPITGPVGVENDMLYCSDDYFNLYASRCAGCNEFIQGTVTRALGKYFHPDCFVCSRCGTLLKNGEYYTKANDPNPYCLEHAKTVIYVHRESNAGASTVPNDPRATRLQQLIAEKDRAVATEDYDKASTLKKQIAALRMEIDRSVSETAMPLSTSASPPPQRRQPETSAPSVTTTFTPSPSSSANVSPALAPKKHIPMVHQSSASNVLGESSSAAAAAVAAAAANNNRSPPGTLKPVIMRIFFEGFAGVEFRTFAISPPSKTSAVFEQICTKMKIAQSERTGMALLVERNGGKRERGADT